MTATSFGPKQQPRFAAGDAPDLSGNPTEVAEYAAAFGNYTTGTTAERNALGSTAWNGLEFYDTTIGAKFIFNNGAWTISSAAIVSANVPVPKGAVIKAVNQVVRTGSDGVARFPWPGGRFPNDLLSFSPTIGDGVAFTGWVSNVASSATEAVIIARNPSGPVGGTQMRFMGLAIGW